MHSIYARKLAHLYTLWDQYGGEKILNSFTKMGHGSYAVYGAGKMGIKMIAALKAHFGTTPIAFIDQNAASGVYYVEGVPVYTPTQLFEKYGDIPIGVAVAAYTNGTQAEAINSALRLAGFTTIIRLLNGDAYNNDISYMEKIDRDKTIAVIDMLYDDEVKEQYYAYIYSRIWKTDFFAPTYPPSAGYSATDLFELTASDHVLDCGAYDGDSARQLLANYTQLKYVTLFEPDADSYKRLVKWAQSVPDRRLNVIPNAVSNTSGKIGFISGKNFASRIDTCVEENVICCRIDDLTYEIPPSFIKMDVEGAELDALKGAEYTIRHNRPILAISLYHKADDIYTIPLYIKGLCPDYKLFVRKNYPYFATYDFILYAIPPERLL